MTNLIKYLGIYLLLISTMTVILLEMDFEIIKYLAIYGLIGISLFYLLKYFKFYNLKSNIIIIIIITSLFPTYILTASIMIYETDIAYSKIKSIPKENLIEFYNTNDINAIPQEKRHVWIGVLYKEINRVNTNGIGNIKAVGWKGHSVFAYYIINEDDYYGSYH